MLYIYIFKFNFFHYNHPRFHSMASWYFRDANGLVLVYDISHIRSFERVSGWVENVRKSAPSDVVIFLVSTVIFNSFTPAF